MKAFLVSYSHWLPSQNQGAGRPLLVRMTNCDVRFFSIEGRKWIWGVFCKQGTESFHYVCAISPEKYYKGALHKLQLRKRLWHLTGSVKAQRKVHAAYYLIWHQYMLSICIQKNLPVISMLYSLFFYHSQMFESQTIVHSAEAVSKTEGSFSYYSLKVNSIIDSTGFVFIEGTLSVSEKGIQPNWGSISYDLQWV